MKGRQQDGVALLVVLWVIMVLSLLIGGFAFTMHVETQVASFARNQLHAEMLARSGIELARMQLIQDAQAGITSVYDARNQPWATNADLYVNHALGDGTINVKVIDEESKLPVNKATQEQLKRVFDELGVEADDSDVIVDSILDWIQPGDLHRLDGAKDDYYMSLSPPYHCKGAPLDRVEELLLVRGVTPELVRGTPAKDNDPARPPLAEVLTTTSSGQVNVNTASPLVLKTLLGNDALVDAIVTRRNGSDGVLGTEDDQPFQSTAEFLQLLPNLPPVVLQELQPLLTVNSSYFTVTSVGQVGNVKHQIVATMHRNIGELTVVAWREMPGV